MSSLQVEKNLITEEDVAYGEGLLVQQRQGTPFALNQVRGVYPVNSLAELNALDPVKHPKAAVYVDGAVEFYVWDASQWVAVDEDARLVERIETFKADIADENDYANGATLVGRAIGNVATYNSVRALDSTFTAKLIYVVCRENIFDEANGVFQLDQADFTTPDNDGTVLVDSVGRRWKRHWAGVVNARWFGCVPGADISVTFQKAIDTKRNVYLPAGRYYSSVTFKRYKGQVISGEGVPERSISTFDNITRIDFTTDVEGFENQTNIAQGGGIRNMVLLCAVASTKAGIRDGIEGIQGGSSQPLCCLHENLVIKNFKRSYQLSGWAWETTLRRVIADAFEEYGICLFDAANIVHVDNCSAILSATKASGARTGFYISQAKNVVLTAPRAENNRTGFNINNGAIVTINGMYSEGNRDYDVNTAGDGTQVTINGYTILHQNQGQNTVSCFRTAPTMTRRSAIRATNGTVLVSAGAAGTDNTMTAFYVGESDCVATFLDIDWRGDGSLWVPFTGRYAPDTMTFTQLPGVTVRRVGNSDAISYYDRYNGASAPSDAHFTLTDYDGVTKVLKWKGSRVISHNYDNGVDFWVWDGAAWVASNR